MQLLYTILKGILSHPFSKKQKLKAVLRFIKWQIGARVLGMPAIHQFTPKSKLIVELGLYGATGNIYNGLNEFHEMCFLLHYLKQSDLFIDVGANIGSYTVLASSHVGCKTIAIEPSEDAFYYLNLNLRLNDIDDIVVPLNIGAGRTSQQVKFTRGRDTTNRIATKNDTNTEIIQLKSLDEIILQYKINPSFIKIDVEGFESEVLMGSSSILKNIDLNIIIAEDVNHGKEYGFSKDSVASILKEHNFLAYSYNGFERALSPKTIFNSQNTIFIRDIEKAKTRIKESDTFKLHGVRI